MIEKEYEEVVLAGYKNVNDLGSWGSAPFYKMEFPIEAFISYLLSEGLPIPECWQEKASAMVASKQNDAQESSTCVTQKALAGEVASDSLVIAEGVTVADIRAMIDPNAPTYCPRFLASILTKKELMPREAVLLKREDVYKREAKDCSLKYLRKLGVIDGNQKNKVENPDPSNEDRKAVSRILCRTKDFGNGRPRET